MGDLVMFQFTTPIRALTGLFLGLVLATAALAKDNEVRHFATHAGLHFMPAVMST